MTLALLFGEPSTKEEKLMAEQILVALERHDRIEEIIPYLLEVAKAGMKVVFLIAYPVEAVSLRDYWITTESVTEAMLAGRRITERSSWEVQRGLAELRISPAREALEKSKVDVAVNIYTGSLRSTVEDYAANKDVLWILLRRGLSHPLLRLLNRTIPLYSLIKTGSPPPVLFLRRVPN